MDIAISHEFYWAFILILGLLLVTMTVQYWRLRQRLLIEKNIRLDAEVHQGHQVELINQELRAAYDQVSELAHKNLQLEKDIRKLDITAASQQVRLEEQQKSLTAEQMRLEQMRESLKKEFELLSNRLFDAKQEHFVRSAKSNLEQVISPFQNQIHEFYQRLERSQRDEVAQRNQLVGKIGELQQQSKLLGEEATNLSNALRGNNKLLGSWGELILSRLLEDSGLIKSLQYKIQYSTVNDEGRRMQPDVVVHLPGDRDVVIDSKISLISYEKFVNAENAEDRELALKSFGDSIRAHIKNLAQKKYGDLEGLKTLEFVFMFIPIEAAFVAIVQEQPDILVEAYNKNIVLTGPSNLMIALRTVDSLWQREKQERNVEKIVDSAGKLYDHFVRFVESIKEVGQALERANTAYQTGLKRLCDGRGNLVKRVEDIKNMGAKTSKSLPEDILERAEAGQSELKLSSSQTEEA